MTTIEQTLRDKLASSHHIITDNQIDNLLSTHYLERACEIQIKTLSANQEINLISDFCV